MYKKISGGKLHKGSNIKYILWQCSKRKKDTWFFADTKLSDNGKIYSCVIGMVDDNWTKW